MAMVKRAALAVLMSLAGAAGAQTGDSPGQVAKGVDASSGAQVYREICQACHMPNAEGGTGAAAIPALAKNPHLADPDFVVTTLLKGRGGMPAFNGMLEPAQIAAVATHIRTHYGNDYPKPVTRDDVKRLAPAGDAGD